MDTVKYSRREYRQEYLKSQHWIELRASILTGEPVCFKCQTKPASDVHHMRYKNIVDVTSEDLIPLCRECHSLIEEAKRIGLIRKKHNKDVILKTTPQLVKEEKKRLRAKTIIHPKIVASMHKLGPPCYQLIFGILKRRVPQDEWPTIMVTGAQLKKMWRVITVPGIAKHNGLKIRGTGATRIQSIHY